MGVGKNPSSINYANEMRIIFTQKKTIEFEWLEELARAGLRRAMGSGPQASHQKQTNFFYL
jgi:hypothetical protein